MNKREETIKGLEDRIAHAIFTDNGAETQFAYVANKNWLGMKLDPEWTVRVFTKNKRTGVQFLLKEVITPIVDQGLMDILYYLTTLKEENDSFTVEWIQKGKKQDVPEKSYFYCKDIVEVLEKFYDNHERDEFIVYSIKVNPRA